MNVLLTYLDLIGHLSQIEHDERLQRFAVISFLLTKL